jgi:hypothetical protein
MVAARFGRRAVVRFGGICAVVGYGTVTVVSGPAALYGAETAYLRDLGLRAAAFVVDEPELHRLFAGRSS